MKTVVFAAALALAGCGPEDPCAELYNTCVGTLEVVCRSDDRFCESSAPSNQAARAPVLEYCVHAYDACEEGR